MFTEAERLRAIELYFKYGRKLAPVVRELGYPSKRNLRRWIRLWEASNGATKSIRRKPRYSDVQKLLAPVIQDGNSPLVLSAPPNMLFP